MPQRQVEQLCCPLEIVSDTLTPTKVGRLYMGYERNGPVAGTAVVSEAFGHACGGASSRPLRRSVPLRLLVAAS